MFTESKYSSATMIENFTDNILNEVDYVQL